MRSTALLALVLATGCVHNAPRPDTPENRAQAVIAASLVGTTPQRLMPAVARCAGANATAEEFDILQSTIDLAPNAQTRRIARGIILRADTQTCLRENGVAMKPKFRVTA